MACSRKARKPYGGPDNAGLNRAAVTTHFLYIFRPKNCQTRVVLPQRIQEKIAKRPLAPSKVSPGLVNSPSPRPERKRGL